MKNPALSQLETIQTGVGFCLIGLGILVALLNWAVLQTRKERKRVGMEANISMIGLIGLALPLGCLFVPSFCWHALWIWIVDPFCVYTFFYIGSEIRDWVEGRIWSNKQNHE